MHFRKHIGTILPLVISGVILFIGWNSVDILQYREHFSRDTVRVDGEQLFISDAQVVINQKDEKFILNMIESAQKRIYVSVYSFTLPSLREAIVGAKNRDVDVRVILEKTPFQTPTINRETRDFLQQNNIRLHESGVKQFSFMHAKFLIVDDEWIVATSNWTRSSFAKNREIYVRGNDPLILKNLESIFLTDFDGGSGVSSDVRLLAGPTNARERLIGFLGKTKNNISIYAPSLSDESLIQQLQKICHEGIQVQVLLAYYPDSVNPGYDCLQVRWLKKKSLHAKSIIIDDEYAFVGSFNYTKNSLENNREVGVFVSGQSVDDIAKVFRSDWENAEVALVQK